MVLHGQAQDSSCIRFVAAGEEKEATKKSERRKKDREDKFVAIFSRRCLVDFGNQQKQTKLVCFLCIHVIVRTQAKQKAKPKAKKKVEKQEELKAEGKAAAKKSLGCKFFSITVIEHMCLVAISQVTRLL